MFARSLFHGIKRSVKPLSAEFGGARSRDLYITLPARSFSFRRASSSAAAITPSPKTRGTTARPPRALVLCFDGTGDSFDDDCTNVVRFVEALEKRRPDKQVYYYQPGIGTYLQSNSSWSSTRQWIAKKLDQGLAWYLDAHIMGGYRFLMENYQPGDKICLFGFSRGAYTARCLAGMIHKVGLLPNSNDEHVAFAYQKYLDDTPKGRKDAQAYKRAFSIPAPIEFVGVWDTVASVGWTFKHLPFTDSNTIIKSFRHALALDEHRVQFMPNPWHNSSKNPDAGKHDPDGGTTKESQGPGTVRGWLSLPKKVLSAIFRPGPVDAGGDDNLEHDTDDDHLYNGGEPTNVKEVWFAGCHADVGGGSTPNDKIHTLANPSLQWMVTEVLGNAPDVLFRPDAFTYDKAFSTFTVTESDPTPKPARLRIPSTFRRAAAGGRDPSSSPTPAPLSTLTAATPRSSTLNGVDVEEEQKLKIVKQAHPKKDANARLNDQLVKKRVWLILEYIPTFQYYQDGNGTWQWRFRWNARRPREIHDSTPNIHASVKLRKDYEGKWLTKFIPKAGEQVKITYVES
ncbi:hypothetical protein M407DRAFT_21037 [Tulasnella calospora MUT 4182]|uniref:T6SS Phospholipase effector Tle1-like catalytic domain-containing protein n=1 Tax=Tulasnella calospora MUT 4182 TaxID=1051891 RepID=A0A0C3L7F7_9AGAM|nr:hypothetical protein M407DRAFT_21037 [Tulasnella calospora MUT 4182]